MKKSEFLAEEQPSRKPNWIFVHSYLDEYGLDPYEFRLIAHIARRGKCFASLTTTAEICKMSVRKAQDSLKFLCNAGFLEKEDRKGRTDVYKLAPHTNWANKEDLDQIRERTKAPKYKKGAGEHQSPANEG